MIRHLGNRWLCTQVGSDPVWRPSTFGVTEYQVHTIEKQLLWKYGGSVTLTYYILTVNSWQLILVLLPDWPASFTLVIFIYTQGNRSPLLVMVTDIYFGHADNQRFCIVGSVSAHGRTVLGGSPVLQLFWALKLVHNMLHAFTMRHTTSNCSQYLQQRLLKTFTRNYKPRLFI